MADRGKHQWSVVAVYALTDEEAAYRGPIGVPLNSRNRLSVEGPGCLNCEEPWTPALAAKPCPADWYDMSPRPGSTRVFQD